MSELQRAQVDLLRAETVFVVTRGRDAPPLLVEAARRLSALDPTLARETYLEALSAAMFAGRLAGPGAGVLEVARAARTAPAPPQAPRAPDVLLDGLTTLFSESYEAAVPVLRQAHTAFDAAGMSAAEQLRWKWLATVSSVHLWDDARWELVADGHVQLARKTGALGELPFALTQRVYVHLFAGELTTAASLVEEIQTATDASDSVVAPYGAVGLLVLRGHQAEASYLIEHSREELDASGRRRRALRARIGPRRSSTTASAATRTPGPPRSARPRTRTPSPPRIGPWSSSSRPPSEPARPTWPTMPSGVSSAGPPRAARTGHSGSRPARGRFSSTARTPKASTVEAIARLARSRMAVDLARAHLLYGEWLRRERRRVDARKELRAAHDLFSAFGTEAFAERARVELQATGERARKRTPRRSTS